MTVTFSNRQSQHPAFEQDCCAGEVCVSRSFISLWCRSPVPEIEKKKVKKVKVIDVHCRYS